MKLHWKITAIKQILYLYRSFKKLQKEYNILFF